MLLLMCDRCGITNVNSFLKETKKKLAICLNAKGTILTFNSLEKLNSQTTITQFGARIYTDVCPPLERYLFLEARGTDNSEKLESRARSRKTGRLEER